MVNPSEIINSELRSIWDLIIVISIGNPKSDEFVWIRNSRWNHNMFRDNRYGWHMGRHIIEKIWNGEYWVSCRTFTQTDRLDTNTNAADIIFQLNWISYTSHYPYLLQCLQIFPICNQHFSPLFVTQSQYWNWEFGFPFLPFYTIFIPLYWPRHWTYTGYPVCLADCWACSQCLVNPFTGLVLETSCWAVRLVKSLRTAQSA